MSRHTAASYDDKADRYAEAQEVSPWALRFDRPAALRFLPTAVGLDVLDAGCGPGFFTSHFVNQGARVVACDFHQNFVERTRRRVGNAAVVHQADLTRPLTFCAEASFDLVVALLVLAAFQISTDVVFSTKASDWKKVKRELAVARAIRGSGRASVS